MQGLFATVLAISTAVAGLAHAQDGSMPQVWHCTVETVHMTNPGTGALEVSPWGADTIGREFSVDRGTGLIAPAEGHLMFQVDPADETDGWDVVIVDPGGPESAFKLLSTSQHERNGVPVTSLRVFYMELSRVMAGEAKPFTAILAGEVFAGACRPEGATSL